MTHIHRHLSCTIILILLVSCTFFSEVFAEQKNPTQAPPEEYPEDIAARLQSRFDQLQSLSFQFYQDVRGEVTGRPRQGSGNAYFLKNEKRTLMRWNYQSPDMQVIVSDGKKISMYFSELQQMIVSPAESLDADITYSFFTGHRKLAADFYIRPPDDDYQPLEQEDVKTIKLIPKKMQSQIQDIHVWVSRDSLIRRLSLRDHFGTITVLNFSDIEVNKLQDRPKAELDALFSFTPPEGTEIIEQ